MGDANADRPYVPEVLPRREDDGGVGGACKETTVSEAGGDGANFRGDNCLTEVDPDQRGTDEEKVGAACLAVPGLDYAQADGR